MYVSQSAARQPALRVHLSCDTSLHLQGESALASLSLTTQHGGAAGADQNAALHANWVAGGAYAHYSSPGCSHTLLFCVHRKTFCLANFNESRRERERLALSWVGTYLYLCAQALDAMCLLSALDQRCMRWIKCTPQVCSMHLQNVYILTLQKLVTSAICNREKCRLVSLLDGPFFLSRCKINAAAREHICAEFIVGRAIFCLWSI